MTDSITIKLLKTLQRGYDTLGEQAKQLMADFIISQRSADGGFVNKQGESDLYYTAFGTLLQYIFNIKFSTEELNDYLDKIDAEGLDLIHYAAYMRCGLLASIAEKTKLDISTISRVSNSKYVQTNYGIFPLRFFFSDGYTTEEGEELSIREIKQLLKESVEHENKENPYNDDELADILKEKGYPVARRTVAKYRQQLNIPTARLRRI